MPAPGFELSEYLALLGCPDPSGATEETLYELHTRHLAAIPFSTLDTLVARPAPLDLSAITRKLVRERRGGYCVEQNVLLATALSELGFTVRYLGAQVRHGSPDPRPRPVPRPHLLLEVTTPHGHRHLADVGFGGPGLLTPLPLEPGRVDSQSGWHYRVHPAGDRLALQLRQESGWTDLYVYSPLPLEQAELVMMHHFCTSHPKSALYNLFWAQNAVAGLRTALWLDWADPPGSAVLTREVASGQVDKRRVLAAELPGVLADQLGVVLPPDTALPEFPPVP